MNVIHQDGGTYLHSHERLGLLLSRILPLLDLHAVQCVAIVKPGWLRFFAQKTLASNLSYLDFVLSLLSDVGIVRLVLEFWFCSLETSSWRLSQI